MSLSKALDKAYEGKSLKELADAPVSALTGVSEADAELLAKAFKVNTVRDLAQLKYVRWAQAIVALGEVEA